MSQIMGAESNNETPNVKTNLINRESLTLRTIFRSASLPMTGKTAGATKPAPIGAASLGASAPPSGTTTSPPTVGPVMGAPGSLATAPLPPGTPGKGSSAAKSDKNPGKTMIGPKADESQVAGNSDKAKDSGKAQNPVTDKAGKPKGPEKVSLDELFTPDPANFRFYGSKGNTEKNMSDMETEGEEHPNPRKRKSAPVLEHQSSEDEEEPAQDQVLVENLIQTNTEALERNQELEQMVKNQELKFRLLARAGQIPEAKIDNLLLA